MLEKSKSIDMESLRSILIDILYLDEGEIIEPETKIFSELDLSSIDYIDLCYELKKLAGHELSPEELWPINSYTLDKALFDDGQWTSDGWIKVCDTLGIDHTNPREGVRELYHRFTPSYILYRLENLYA